MDAQLGIKRHEEKSRSLATPSHSAQGLVNASPNEGGILHHPVKRNDMSGCLS
jgi:hypothetical protein